jgi:pimeloyl-ACP methyl ester carboxylesterase
MTTESPVHLSEDISAQGGMQDAPTQSSARFMSRAGVELLGLALRLTSKLSTQAGAKLGYRILSQPPRFKTPERERASYANARHSHIPFGMQTLKVLEWGQGPTVLLVHCWGGRATQLCGFVDALVSRGMRVVSFDGPAHGESAGKRTDMFEFPQALATVARSVAPVEGVIAHSFGAAMTLLALRDLGLSAKRFVLISSFKSCDWFLDAFGQYFRTSPRVIQQMRDDFDVRRGEPVMWAQLSMIEVIAQIKEPILLVHDESDTEIPFSHAVLLQRASNGAELLATKGLGHRRILRDPSVIQQAVHFLSRDSQGALK